MGKRRVSNPSYASLWAEPDVGTSGDHAGLGEKRPQVQSTVCHSIVWMCSAAAYACRCRPARSEDICRQVEIAVSAKSRYFVIAKSLNLSKGKGAATQEGISGRSQASAISTASRHTHRQPDLGAYPCENNRAALSGVPLSYILVLRVDQTPEESIPSLIECRVSRHGLARRRIPASRSAVAIGAKAEAWW